ncbi:MAG: RHS repeat domain-containing protein [Oceanicaulis sp.]
MVKLLMLAAGMFTALSGLSIASAAASETVTYTYDARGRLVEVEHTGGPAAGTKTTYEYDDADNIKRKKTTGA